jgi:hypothetical protein
MNNQQIILELVSKLEKEHVFWSYDNYEINQISNETLISKVLLHLDIYDIQSLFKLFPKRFIQQVWKNEMLSQNQCIMV